MLQAQPDASGTINPSAQKAAKATIQTLTNLLQLAQLAPELASHQSDLATLLTQATSDYQFADRIAYGKVEIANLMKRRQNNPNPTVDYFYNRLVSKLQILSNAPGIKTTDNFNDLEASILNPLISLTTDPTQAALLQSLHDTIEASKQSILEQQKTFIYHFNAAVAQQTNTSLYISMLQTIITNERKGLITFDETSSSTTSSGAVQSHVPDSTTFFNALTTAVAQRDILSATDCSNLATAINYALYSDVYTARADLQPKLQMLYTQASTPIAFADRVTTYATKVSSILKLLPTDQDRVNYFTVLSTLSSAPGNLTTDSLNKLVNTIMTPLSASPLASNEQSIITALQQFVAGAQTQVKSAAYQMSLLPLVADWGVVISTLQTMLNNKGISVIFASEDIQLFINALTMLVNNRELLQVNTSTQSSVTTAAGQSVLIQNLITLLRTTELAAEFTASKTTLDQLIAAAGTDHLFADRIAYMQTEIATMTPIQQKNSNDPMLQIMFDRMIAKLTIILNASGPMTSSLFDTLDVGVITPLLALVDTDARRQQIQAVRSTIQSSKATVLQQQATFTYQYNLAQTQAANPSMYVNMLQGIINGQRQGTITFSGSDAQTFITALTTAVKTRDNLSDSDTTALINAINYALFSDVYTSNQAFQNTLQQLLTTASTPIPFADRVATYSAKAKSIIAIKDSTDATRVAYFNCLQALPGAPGVQTTDSLTLLQNSVITPFTSSPMSQNEQTIIKALQSFVTTAQTTIKTATYQLAALLSEPDISKYLAGLQDLLTRKGTYFTFVPTDYTNFASQVAYIVNSRELLDTRGLNAAQKLVTSTQASADFSTLSTTLKPLATQITQPFYFNDRVTWMITEIQQIVSRSPAATDPMLIRFITKLGLLLNAPQINTTDQQFSDLQAKVLTPLGALNLSPDQQTQVQTLSNQILALKSQVLLTATTFQYQFGLAQAQLANTDAYLDILTSIMTKHHSGELTFSGNDNVTMLKAVQDLVNNRDILSKAQITIVQALITYCGASSLYQDQASQTTCLNLMQQLAQPIPLAQLVAKYSSQVKSIIFLSSDDPARTLFFTQLGNMAQSTDSVPPTLITQINNTLITPLNSANPSFNEQTVIKNLQSFVAGATQKAQSVSNLLQMADDSNPALIDYANAVAGIMQQKGSPLTFSDSDTTNALGALAYVSASRELLSADQIKTVLQLINRIQWLGTFKDNDAQLQSILADLNTIHLFQDRVNYASQELKALMASNANPAGNRMARLVLKLSTVLSATGPAVASDFNTLQNTLTQLQTLALPTAQMQTVTNLIAQVAASQSSILAAQQTFAYNYAQAQLIQNNLPNYILALKNIISLKRQNQMNFDPADYATFVNALSAVSANQDAMTTADISNLKDAINYTYYSAGFTTYQQALTDLYNTLNTPPTFAQRVGQYAAQISAILQLDGADPKRIQFFANIQFMPNLQGSGNIADVQNFITSMLTPLQTTPLNQSEQAVVATLAQFVASVQQKATALSYNLTQLATQVSAAQNDTTQDPMSVMVSGLNTILTQINAGTIKLAGNDYQSLLTVVSGLVDNRELFTAAEVTQVQSILQSMQFNAGFAAFKDTLGTLYTNAATPLTFADRVAKYVTNFPQINNTPTGDPSKGQFITMVSSIFNAPGTITNDLLTTLQNQVVNPIKYGNFSDDQKGKMSQVIMQLTAQQNTLNSFKYRFTQAQNEVTPQAYYADLTQMINDLTAGTLTFAANDFSTFLSELTNQVALRPMTPDTQSSVYSLVQLVKTAPTFATRADLVSTITQLMSLLNTPVDPLVRINYFEQNIMVMLGQPITSGQRQQFFVRLGQFSSELTSLTADILAQPTVQQALQQLATTLNQDAQSSNAQSNEQILMTSVARQLQDISGTTAATLVPTVATTTGLTSGGVLLPTTIPQTTPTTSRAYTRAPVSRFAR